MNKNKDLNLVGFLNDSYDKKTLISYIMDLLETIYDGNIETYSVTEIYINYFYKKYAPESEDDVEEIFNEEFGFYNEWSENPVADGLKMLIKDKKGEKMNKNTDLNLVEFLNDSYDKKTLISYIMELLETIYSADLETYAGTEMYVNYLYKKYAPENEDDVEEICIEEFGFYNEELEDPVADGLKMLIKDKKGEKNV